MKNRTLLLLLLNAALLTVTPVAFADDDKDESGKGRYRGKERKQEYWDGNCKVERKWEKNGDFKEERKCNGPDRHAERKEEFDDGNCKVERKWEKNGSYKEERKCKDGREQARAQASPPRAVAYPPWIVMQQGAPVYVQEHRPAVPVAGVSRCNSQRVGQVLGGVVGGVLGNQIGKGDGRTVATIGGAVAGLLIGGEVGRRLDANDQTCVGEVLEFAPAGQRVQWPSHGTQYVVVPGNASRRGDSYCRPYTVEVQTPNGWQRTRERACRRPDGVWQPA
jgi:surface antigen